MHLTQERANELFDKYVKDFTNFKFDIDKMSHLTGEECIFITNSIVKLSKMALEEVPENDLEETTSWINSIIYKWIMFDFKQIVNNGFYAIISKGTNLPIFFEDYQILAYTDVNEAKKIASDINKEFPGLNCIVLEIEDEESSIDFMHSMVNVYGYNTISFNDGLETPIITIVFNKGFINDMIKADYAFKTIENPELCRKSLLLSQDMYMRANGYEGALSENKINDVFIRYYMELLVSNLVIPVNKSNGNYKEDAIQIKLDNGNKITPVFTSSNAMHRIMENQDFIVLNGTDLLIFMDYYDNLILDFNTYSLPILREGLIGAIEFLTNK